MTELTWKEKFQREFTELGSFKVYGTPVEMEAFIQAQLEELINDLPPIGIEELQQLRSKWLNK